MESKDENEIFESVEIIFDCLSFLINRLARFERYHEKRRSVKSVDDKQKASNSYLNEQIHQYVPIIFATLSTILDKIITDNLKITKNSNSNSNLTTIIIKFTSLLASKFKKKIDRHIYVIIMKLIKIEGLKEAVVNLLHMSNEQQISFMKIECASEDKLKFVGCLEKFNRQIGDI